MHLRKVMFSLVLTCLVAANCVAQDESPKAKKAAERAVANLTKQTMKQFAAAKLTDEQKEKAAAIVKKHVGAVTEARKAQDSILTDDQKKSRTEAIAKAKKDGVKGNKVYAMGVKAMGLSEEEQKKYDKAKKKFQEVQGKMKSALMEILTDEQKAAMPKRGKGNKKKKKNDKATSSTQTVSLKLPGMT
jgi:hypothetical protein